MKLQGAAVAVFYPFTGLASNPGAVALLDALRREARAVDLYAAPQDVSGLLGSGSGLAVHRFPRATRLWSGDIRSTLRHWRWWATSLNWQVERRLRREPYDLYIGVNDLGVVSAARYARQMNRPLVYVSYEIMFRAESTAPWELRDKEDEIRACSQAQLIVVQDPDRAKLLADENGLSCDERFFLLPVAPRDGGEPVRGNILRETLSIPQDRTILLHPGTFRGWTCAEELLASAREWPSHLVLVVHSPFQDASDSYIRQAKAAGPNVKVSTAAIPHAEYNQLLASADLGLVHYRAEPPSRFTQRNVETIGLSSGKLASFAMNGVPVISVRQPQYRKLQRHFPFGIDIDSFAEIPAAADRLRAQFARYQQGARAFFTDYLSFDCHWPALRETLERLLSP